MEALRGEDITAAIRATWKKTKDIGALRMLAPGYDDDDLKAIAVGSAHIEGDTDTPGGLNLGWVQ